MKKNYINDFFKSLGTSKVVVFIVSWILYLYVYALYKSLRIKFKNIDIFKETLSKGPGILLFWHGRSLVVGPFWRTTFKGKYDAAAIFSTHRDGIFMEKIMTRFKIGAIRGSTNENSKAAAVAIYKALKNNTSIALTIDGPTGPRFVIKAFSPFYFSSKLQVPIYSLAWSSEKGKITKNWDRYFIPRFFRKTVLNFSKPLIVKKDATDKEIEEIARNYEKMMLKELHEADATFGFDPIPQQPRDLTKKRKDI